MFFCVYCSSVSNSVASVIIGRVFSSVCLTLDPLNTLKTSFTVMRNDCMKHKSSSSASPSVYTCYQSLAECGSSRRWTTFSHFFRSLRHSEACEMSLSLLFRYSDTSSIHSSFVFPGFLCPWLKLLILLLAMTTLFVWSNHFCTRLSVLFSRSLSLEF